MQNPLACHSEEQSNDTCPEPQVRGESRILLQEHPRNETLRCAQSDIILICIQTLANQMVEPVFLSGFRDLRGDEIASPPLSGRLAMTGQKTGYNEENNDAP